MTDIDANAMIACLHSIDATLKELLALSKLKRGATTAPADDADLDTAAGDETIKFKPRDWPGSDCKGMKMSECPPEFLDMLAASFDYFARRNDENNEKDAKGRPKSNYDRQSARRARGWAARLRGGWKPKETPQVKADEVSW